MPDELDLSGATLNKLLQLAREHKETYDQLFANLEREESEQEQRKLLVQFKSRYEAQFTDPKVQGFPWEQLSVAQQEKFVRHTYEQDKQRLDEAIAGFHDRE